jgi:hypothetical protein
MWPAPCTMRRGAHVSWFSLKTKVDSFSWFDFKTCGYDFCGLASKPLARVSWFGPQNWWLWFGDLAHKINVTVSLFGPQNQVDYGLLVAPQNRWGDEDVAEHTSRPSGLLRLEMNWARIF